MRIVVKTKKNNILEFLFFFFIFFPYIKILPLESDTQPYALLITIFLLISQISYLYKKKIISLSFLLGCSLAFILFLISINSNSLRGLVGYITILLVYSESVILLQNHKFNLKLFHIFSIIWIIVGIIQLKIPSFLAFIIAAQRTTEGRCVFSLAVEPSYFGIMLQFFIIINVICHGEKKYNILYALSIVFLSKSAMAIAYLFVFIIIYSMKNKKLFYFYLLLFVCMLLIINSNSNFYLEKSSIRAISILQTLLKNGPIMIVKLDASINDRIGSIWFSLKGCIDNFLLPKGFSYWPDYVDLQLQKQNVFYNITTHKILSLIGSVVFIEGFFGFFIVGKLLLNTKYLHENSIVFFVFLFLFYLTAIPLSFPLIGFITALLKYNYYESDINTTSETICWKKNTYIF